MFRTLKEIMKYIMRTIKNTNGNSLAEFAVTTAMMATLATTAAPKFGAVGAGAKEKKTMANIDKILTVANNYYNQTLSEEGKGRFPGQEKYDVAVGGIDLAEGASTDETLEAYVETILDQKVSYTDDLSEFVYVFSPAADDDDALQNDWMSLETSVGFDGGDEIGALDFKKDFGNNGLTSPFQDGSYSYLIIPGSGSGTSAQAPVLVVIDTENPSKLHKTLVP
tara:strand:- start:479 stop:1147 length:669 start_codon:yes stop_codon:yes gene_type:complete